MTVLVEMDTEEFEERYIYLVTLSKSADPCTREAAREGLDRLVRIAGAGLVKVGPKGYIHNWIFVGPQAAGSRVFHGGHGHGTVTRSGKQTVTVRFDSGKKRTFERGPSGRGGAHFVDRAGQEGGKPAGEAPKPARSGVSRGGPRQATENRHYGTVPLPTPDPLRLGDKEALAWGDKHMVDPTTFTPKQLDALGDYGAGEYRGINGALRSGDVPPEARALIDQIDSAMAKSTVPHDVLVTREASTDMFKGMSDAQLRGLAGKVLQEPGYMSTALGTDPPYSLFDMRMEIAVPKGTHAVWMKPVTGLDQEREMLLDRGTRLAVDSMKWDARREHWVLKATVVPA